MRDEVRLALLVDLEHFEIVRAGDLTVADAGRLQLVYIVSGSATFEYEGQGQRPIP